jgi:hypothetical protein
VIIGNAAALDLVVIVVVGEDEVFWWRRFCHE